MYQVDSGFQQLAVLVKDSIHWPAKGSCHVILDAPTGYGLLRSKTMLRPCLIVTPNLCPLYLQDLLQNEPDGLIAPNGVLDFGQIERAISEIIGGGHVYIGPPLNEPSSLISRERQVVRLAALGCENQTIAKELDVSEKTVRNVISSITAKLGLKNRVQLCHFYLGLFPSIMDGYPG